MKTGKLPSDPPPLRWGFVGTGNIAGWMADVVRGSPSAELAAVASRSTENASAFAATHGAGKAFDSWERMLAWDGIDAVYVATPTALREEICVAAAAAGKHVLGEKPFASLLSLQRITAACRKNGVAFMDATHFVHHPRTAQLLAHAEEMTGRPETLDSSFLISLTDRGDIRYDPALEPLGALGDLGWYNMRAALEYLAADSAVRSVSARLRHDEPTGVIVAGEGSIEFDNDTLSTWRCGFDADTVSINLTLSGSHGWIHMENFVGEEEGGTASYRYWANGNRAREDAGTAVRVDSAQSGPALMFRNFATDARDPTLREQRMHAAERTQALLDAVRVGFCPHTGSQQEPRNEQPRG
ncbi:Gfo/Idh/MocA family protein [Lentisalinibacter orientalis]|uniref:Gfo/Idh/MocA family protein n=1 Tax=Lentisalinibacter orientalis TaxID=2992241 RepID=UPI0038699DA0